MVKQKLEVYEYIFIHLTISFVNILLNIIQGIHGCLLTAWSAAGLVGPSLLGYLRSGSVYNAISDLANNHCDPKVFQQTFGDGINLYYSII